jgi:hypothetical protein
MEAIGLVLLLLLLPLLLFLVIRVRAGKAGELRPLPGMEELPKAVGRSAETNQPLHVSVGVAGVGGAATVETWAGLALLSELAEQAVASDAPLIVTVGDPTVLPIAQDILRRAYARHGRSNGYDPTQVRFIAPVPMAYAAGVMGLLQREPLRGNVMVGTFGDEYLLMGEAGARKGVPQIVGSADPRTLPFVYATADEPLIGEEMFASSPYVGRGPLQVASLLAEDWARWAIIAAIIGLAILKILA